MDQALILAQRGFEKNEVPVGAVFVYEGKVIASAHNVTSSNNGTQHAEIVCIYDLYNQNFDKFNETTLYVTCEPCIMCAQALALVGIKEVFFGSFNNRFGGNGSVFALNSGNYGQQKYLSTGGVQEIQCTELLKKFYERGNQKLPLEQRHRK